MRLFSRKKIGKIKFILLGLGFFLVSFPVVSVYAVAPTITVGSENSFSTGDSPGLSNIFKITSPEENRILIGCPISTVDGLIGNTLKSIETITYTRFDSGIRELECPSARSDISSAPSNNNGILGVLNMATGSILEQRPASGIQFAEEKIYAITNPGKVYAQDPASYFPGTGFDLLQPIRSFWGWSVNLVFGILIVIILFVAFAIILGDKMPGNMKVTLQSAIPNIALAMILVPLSYSISGLFVDFITIGSNAVHDFVLGPASPGYSVYLEREQGPNDRGLYIDDERLTWINARSQVDVRQEVDAIADSGGINNNLLFQVVATILNVFANEEVSNVGTNPSSASAWLGTIINGILSILMIWIGIKILIRLFKKYLSLIIMPIFSPFIFATIAVPGNGTKPIVTYAKSLAASSLGFIVTYLMFLLTIVFSSTAFQSSIPDFRTGLWVPPLIGITQLEELTGAGAGLGIVPFILGLIAIGIYFSIPKVLDQIDDALGAKFSLPEFVRTPIESLRESARVTGGFAFRTAPRALGRGANIIRNTPGALNNTIDNITRLPGNLRQGALQIRTDLNVNRDRRIREEERLGIKDSNPNSIRNADYRALNNQWASAAKALEEARISGDTAAGRAAQNDLDRIESDASRLNVTLTKSLKPDERTKLNVTIKPNYGGSSDNTLIFTTATIDSMVGRRNMDIDNDIDFYDDLGKMVVSIQGNDVRFSPSNILYAHLAIKDDSAGAGPNDMMPSPTEFFALTAASGVVFDKNNRRTFSTYRDLLYWTRNTGHFSNKMKIVIKQDENDFYQNDTTLEIPLSILISDVDGNNSLFGIRTADNTRGVVNWVGGTLSVATGTNFPTPPSALRIIFALHANNEPNGAVIVRSDPVKLFVGKQY